MAEFSATETAFMARALELAARGRYSAHPNPMVGCVLVSGDTIVGEGWHEIAGEAHAEINALRQAGDKARGAAAYVTLEPCSHHGKTPPCTDALIAAGIGECVIARLDPNPKVDGSGQKALRAAGIPVRSGLLAAGTDELIAGFLSRVTRRMPRVTLKMASSIDGCIAMAGGQSQWITGPDAREDVQRWRARSGAIMTGIGTVLADDPSLTVRDKTLNRSGRQPLRVVLDSQLRMPLSAEMLALPGETLLFCSDDQNAGPFDKAGATVITVAGQGEELDLIAVLQELAAREVNDVLVEAGPKLAGRLLEAGLVDELVIYQAPHIMGSETMKMFATPTWKNLADRLELHIVETKIIGADTRITARPKR